MMCGIAALLLHPQKRPAEQWQSLRDTFTANLVFNEDRGNAATGVAVIYATGQVEVCKAPMPASQFVKSLDYRRLLANIDEKTTLVLGHTRLPTKGDPANNRNNHPIRAGPIFGVHNGQVENDDELFLRYGSRRNGDVDSEIIFWLIEHAPSVKKDEHYLHEIRPLIRALEGEFTFLACDRRTPDWLLVLKHKNPLCIHHQPTWNALIFSSRYLFLRKAFGTSMNAEKLEPNQLMLFNAYRISDLRTSPSIALPLYQGADDDPYRLPWKRLKAHATFLSVA